MNNKWEKYGQGCYGIPVELEEGYEGREIAQSGSIY